MIKGNHLIAIIRKSSVMKGMETDFFFKDENGVRGVNKVLGEMIDNYNESQNEKAVKTGGYFLKIPIRTNGYGSMSYSYGCGSTHYLQHSIFKELCDANPTLTKELPLDKVDFQIVVYQPSELRMAQEEYNFQF